MKSYIKVDNIKVNKNIVQIFFSVSDNLKIFFHKDLKFEVDYYEEIEEVPNSILVIPFVSNVIPIIWLTDSELIVKELDKNYYNSLAKTKKAFADMYKKDIFKGSVKVGKLIENKSKKKNNSVSVFSSGGIDSTYSLIKLFKQKKKPLLITVWGTDVWDYNADGWYSLQNYAKKIGKKFKLKNLFIKTNFRSFIYEHVLTESLLKGKIDDSWWRGIQHGIGLLGHVAPFAYKYGISNHHIPATLNKDNNSATCGSFPTIDESVKFMTTKITHSGYEYSRIKKVEQIVKYFKNEPLDLRVCFRDKGRELNCCKCEKCYLTIMELIVLKANPNDWGLIISDEKIAGIREFMLKEASDSPINIEIWDDIIKKAYENKEYLKQNKNYHWILKYKNQRNFLEWLLWKIKNK